MSQWIVFGTGKGIGYFLVQDGLQQGHQVITFIRNVKYKNTANTDWRASYFRRCLSI